MVGILTIIAPPASSALTTLANVKAELGVTATTDDTYIGMLIGRASSVVAEHCGRVFGYQTATEIFRYGSGSYIGPSAQAVAPYGTPLAAQFKPVTFSLFPIVAISDIHENADAPLVNGTDFDLDPLAALAWRIRGNLRSWWGVPTVTATYGAGYLLPGATPVSTEAALPGVVEEATISLIRNAYARRGRDPSVILDVTEGLGRIGYAPGHSSAMAIDDSLAAMLAPYRAGVW